MATIKNVSQNLRAFLDLIAWSEGTYNRGENGYNVIVGGTLFTTYADHPRQLITLPRLGIKSTAAGRYQLLSRYYDAYKKQLGLPDFSPLSQDKIAIQQIKEQRALDDILLGRIPQAIEKCSNIWASFPGAGYGQHEHCLGSLLEQYQKLGGTLA